MDMAKLKEISVGGINFALHQVTGKVINVAKNSTTQVYGGGTVNDGKGYTSVSSSSTIHDQIFLIDKNEKEHSFQLSDFNVASREGNELSVIWAIKEGQERGNYVCIYNHSTDRYFFERDTFLLNFIDSPKAGIGYKIIGILILLIGIAGAIFTFGLSFLLFIPLSMYEKRMKRKRVENVKQFKLEITNIPHSDLK